MNLNIYFSNFKNTLFVYETVGLLEPIRHAKRITGTAPFKKWPLSLLSPPFQFFIGAVKNT